VTLSKNDIQRIHTQHFVLPGRPEPTRVEPLIVLYSMGKLLALPQILDKPKVNFPVPNVPAYVLLGSPYSQISDMAEALGKQPSLFTRSVSEKKSFFFL